MKKVLFVFIALFFVSSISFAQFEVGKSHAGPSIGIGFGVMDYLLVQIMNTE